MSRYVIAKTTGPVPWWWLMLIDHTFALFTEIDHRADFQVLVLSTTRDVEAVLGLFGGTFRDSVQVVAVWPN